VAELLARLEAECEADVHRVILYGSKARGDAVEWSDIDLLIATTNGASEVTHVLDQFKSEGICLIETQVFSDEDWKYYQKLKFPFYVNVRRNGIELWNLQAKVNEEIRVPLDFPEGRFRAMDYETNELIRLEVRESREMGRSAQVVENDGRPLYALPLAYRSAFNLATAALYAVNVVRDKHKGVRDGISQFLVKPKLLEEEYKDIYNRLFDARGYVDYGKAIGEKQDALTDSEAEQLLRDAERLNTRLMQFLREHGALID
jgi:uncharacterized protein (UPF0332 family)/predicted nucleotidyltransferase